MSKTIFYVSYQIDPEKREDFIESIKEYKNLIGTEGLLSYSLFEEKGGNNRFREVFEFESEEAFENFDDVGDERLSVLNRKLESLKIPKTTKSKTLHQIEL